MGEIAEDIVDGACCDLCGQYFRSKKPKELHRHGYPATCWECWKNLTEAERKDRQRSQRPTL